MLIFLLAHLRSIGLALVAASLLAWRWAMRRKVERAQEAEQRAKVETTAATGRAEVAEATATVIVDHAALQVEAHADEHAVEAEATGPHPDRAAARARVLRAIERGR